MVKHYYSVVFYSVYNDSEINNDYTVYDNKALYEFLLNAGIVEVGKAYEISKRIFSKYMNEFTFEDFEPLYNSGLFEKVVIVTEEMVETLQNNLAKYGLDGYNFVYPKCEFVAYINIAPTRTKQ